ncbi:hypothetical protein AAHC03_05025 [Spirometra sp. Aus1]
MNDVAPNVDSKTVFLLLRTLRLTKPTGNPYTFDRPTKSNSGIKRDPVSVEKPLWSFVVEGVLEYARIVFDLFSASKPISIVTVDSEEKVNSIWYEEDQSLEAVWKIFLNEGLSTASLCVDSLDDLPGLHSCKNVLQLPTPAQSTGSIGVNAGRVIVVGTDLKKKIKAWIPEILRQFREPPQEEGYLPINASEWIFVDVCPDPDMSARELKAIKEFQDADHRFFYTRLCTTDRGIYTGMMLLAERNLQLASTLVQDIPMKEEANVSSSSSMYGVELLHEASAHQFLSNLGLAEALYLRHEDSTSTGSETTTRAVNRPYHRPPSGFSRTLGINWVTPRASDNHLIRYSIASFRVTMAAVGNRAAVCLAQFVLGGRSVVLAHQLQVGKLKEEVPTQTTAAAATCFQTHANGETFLLLCHGSVMYLHVVTGTVPESQSVVASRYRQAAFVKNFLHPARLAPASARLMYSLTPKDRALQHVERCTRYWPLTEDMTVLGSNPLSAPLLEHLSKDFLEPPEYNACKQSIELLLEFIKGHPVLKECSSGLLYTQPVAMALELDHLLQECSDLSEEHSQLHDLLQQLFKTTLLSGTRLSLLVRSARTLLARHFKAPDAHYTDPSIRNSPLFKLSHLGRHLISSLAEGDCQTLPMDCEEPFSRDSSNVQLSTMSLEAFMQSLIMASQKPIQSRPEFAGVLASNSKRQAKLYVGIVDDD